MHLLIWLHNPKLIAALGAGRARLQAVPALLLQGSCNNRQSNLLTVLQDTRSVNSKLTLQLPQHLDLAHDMLALLGAAGHTMHGSSRGVEGGQGPTQAAWPATAIATALAAAEVTRIVPEL